MKYTRGNLRLKWGTLVSNLLKSAPGGRWAPNLLKLAACPACLLKSPAQDEKNGQCQPGFSRQDYQFELNFELILR